MLVYRLAEPIDLFDGLTPLNDWLTRQHPSRTAWALQAVLALTDAAADDGWRGDMRHLPMVGALPTPRRTTSYLAIKQHTTATPSSSAPPRSPTSTSRPSSPRSPRERTAPGHPTRMTTPMNPPSDHQCRSAQCQPLGWPQPRRAHHQRHRYGFVSSFFGTPLCQEAARSGVLG